ncbi:NPP1 domain protein [Aspergillus rambellii]|uniref:NPP1 domain protein n=2 Tax=Aspergillus subgen. Nidulantes TaxID=2720870 RepID=A0A0F8UXC2_9EURO|nr:NPP1 domain protein [Aspergillus rambellii]KKK17891.1 NPP1 domain protein [Aspergillus ochraceoroseus]
MLPKTFLAILTALVAVQASPMDKRGVVPHDSIQPMGETVPHNAVGNTFKKFEPGGLQDTGSSTGGCRDQSKGQTYVRGGWHNGRYGIMYAWYMPKDMPNSGVSVGAHRHDWENVVIWVNNPSVRNPTLLGGAASGHGKYKKTTNPQRQGDRPKVEYFTNFPTNHELQFTNTLGRDLPLIAWDSMSPAARRGLEQANFGAATVPFKDSTFQGNLAKAAL